MAPKTRDPRVPISKQQRFEIFKRDSFTCRYCGRSTPDVTLQVDHVNPVANGGTNDDDNLVTSCVECNAGKAATPLRYVSSGRPNDRARIFYIRGIVRNRFPGCDEDKTLHLIRQAWAAGFNLDKLEMHAVACSSWPSFVGKIYAFLPGAK